MKKYFFTLLFFINTLSSFAQCATCGNTINARLDSALTYSFSTPKDSTVALKVIYKTENATKTVSYFNRNAANQLAMYEQIEYMYNSLNQLTCKTSTTTETGSKKQTLYAYDKAGKIISETNSVWQPTTKTWGNELKSEMSYDSLGKISYVNEYAWNKEIDVWQINLRWTYTYNKTNNEVYLTKKLWDATSNTFINSYKRDLGYNTDGKIVLNVDYAWNTASNKFESWAKYESTFHDCDKAIFTNYVFDTQKNLWKLTGKYYFVYDTYGNTLKETLLIPQGTTDQLVNKIYYYYNYTQKAAQRTEVLADNLLNKAETEVSMTVYPNPTADKVMIRYNGADVLSKQTYTIRLSDITGKEIKSIANLRQQEYQLPLTNLTSGIYFIELFDGVKTYRQKIVKE